MNELLFFVLGLVIGGLSGTTLICMIHINNINKKNKDKEICESDQ